MVPLHSIIVYLQSKTKNTQNPNKSNTTRNTTNAKPIKPDPKTQNILKNPLTVGQKKAAPKTAPRNSGNSPRSWRFSYVLKTKRHRSKTKKTTERTDEQATTPKERRHNANHKQGGETGAENKHEGMGFYGASMSFLGFLWAF